MSANFFRQRVGMFLKVPFLALRFLIPFKMCSQKSHISPLD